MSPPSLPSSIGAEYTQPWSPWSSTEWATLQLAPHISLHMMLREAFDGRLIYDVKDAGEYTITLKAGKDVLFPRPDPATRLPGGCPMLSIQGMVSRRELLTVGSVGLTGGSFRVRDPSLRADSSARASGRAPYACTRV